MRGVKRPLQNAPFCPISALGSNFNPQNTQCIPVVKIFACLELEQNSAFFKGLWSFYNILNSNLIYNRDTMNMEF